MQLSGVRPSVGLSVCPIRQPHAAAAGLLLWALPAGVSLSVPSDSRTPLPRVCCCGLCRQVFLCLSHPTAARRRGGFAAVGSAGRCFSVCPILQPHAAAAGLLLWALPAGVSLSVPSDSRTPPRRVCCCGLCRQEIAIDCCTVSNSRAAAAAGECGQCHVVS